MTLLKLARRRRGVQLVRQSREHLHQRTQVLVDGGRIECGLALDNLEDARERRVRSLRVRRTLRDNRVRDALFVLRRDFLFQLGKRVVVPPRVLVALEGCLNHFAEETVRIAVRRSMTRLDKSHGLFDVLGDKIVAGRLHRNLEHRETGYERRRRISLRLTRQREKLVDERKLDANGRPQRQRI